MSGRALQEPSGIQRPEQCGSPYYPSFAPSQGVPGLGLLCAVGLGAGARRVHVPSTLAAQTPWAC